jgi:hypothetical protein
MKQEDFDRWFNSSFWRAFKDQAFPLTIPKSVADRRQLVDKVDRVRNGFVSHD